VQQLHLGAPLLEGQAEVTVEHVQGGAVDAEIHAQTAPRLAAVAGQVAAQRREHRQPREHGVAVGAAAERARLAHHDGHAELRGQVGRLVGVPHAVGPHDFLQADDVGVDLPDHPGDAIDVAAPVEPDATMDVVAGGDQRRHAASW
jgi:hypothetical protein